jgi:hypothetical protein
LSILHSPDFIRGRQTFISSPHGDRFIILMNHDATAKIGPTAGQRGTFEEAGLCAGRNGKSILIAI